MDEFYINNQTLRLYNIPKKYQPGRDQTHDHLLDKELTTAPLILIS